MTTQTIQAMPRSTFGWDTRMASKAYVCRECGGVIQKGESHLVRPHRIGRRLETWREHRICPIPPAPQYAGVKVDYVEPQEGPGPFGGIFLAFLITVAVAAAGVLAYFVANHHWN